MRLSTRGRYGVRFMLDLALHYGKEPVVLKELAERQNISAKYLDQLVGGLRKAGLVRTKRGIRGGFRLAKPPDEINLVEVVETVEGPINVVDCVAHPDGCPRSMECVTRDVWENVSKAIKEVLAQVTLADMVDRQKAKKRSTKRRKK